MEKINTNQIAARLRTLRLSNHLTQQELAGLGGTMGIFYGRFTPKELLPIPDNQKAGDEL